MEFIMNGQAHGSVATQLLDNGFNVSTLRPWVGNDGRHYISRLNQNGKMEAVPLQNATATLRKDEWKILDDAIVMAAKERLRVVADLRSAGLTFNIPQGMGKTVLETESVSDITPASISMDPTRQGEADRPEYDLVNLPLPVIHKDFFFNARQVATSRNSGASIDSTSAENAARRVAEEAEKLVLGTLPTYSYGGGTVYGLTNFPQRMTKTMTSPESTDWTGELLVDEVLEMRQQSINAHHYGPWVIYASPNWDRFLDRDYSEKKGDNTLRQRVEAINGIQGVRTADHLSGYQMIMVQMTSNIIREVIGMDITTVQWETMGGMRINYKVMAIMVPQLRADFNGNTGIVHGSVPA